MTGSRRGNGDGGENVRKAASEQNPATRRVIRSQFLQLKNLINGKTLQFTTFNLFLFNLPTQYLILTEKRDDLMNTESDMFDTILDEFDKLHVQGSYCGTVVVVVVVVVILINSSTRHRHGHLQLRSRGSKLQMQRHCWISHAL